MIAMNNTNVIVIYNEAIEDEDSTSFTFVIVILCTERHLTDHTIDESEK